MSATMSAFTTWLNSLGTTGHLLAAAVPVVIYLLWKRLKPASSSSTVPSPTPNAATAPSLLAGLAPLLHDALVALGRIPAKGATVNDVSHATLVQLGADVTAVIDAHNAIHDAAKVDLRPTSEPTA